MDSLTRLLMQGAAGGAAAGLGIEEVFSTYLYDGDSNSGRIITNGIDLSGEGGLVWVKRYDGSQTHVLQDTERGTGVYLPITTGGNSNAAGARINSFNSDGFTLGNDADVNASAQSYASWTFRKAPGFFDVVTWTGNAADVDASRTISHSLGSVPGTIIVKRTSGASDWQVYHRSLGATKYLNLNQTNAEGTSVYRWRDTAPTSSVFTVGYTINAPGDTYVAYVFAHDEQIFGESGRESVIKCGSYTGSTTASIPIDLGWEPQWVLIKQATGTTSAYSNWGIFDNMRGIATGSNDPVLAANLSVGEGADPPATGDFLELTPTGFIVDPGLNRYQLVNANASSDYIYIAIRRGPMKTPEDATTVLKANTRTGTGADTSVTGIGFSPDLVVTKTRTSSVQDNPAFWFDRLRGNFRYLRSSTAQGEGGTTTGYALAGTAQGTADIVQLNNINRSGDTAVDWFFRRAPGFFDVVAYTGDATAGRTVNHNLGVTPELMIVKSRSNSSDWIVYSSTIGTQPILKLNNAIAATDFGAPGPWNNTTPTSSVFSVSGTGWDTNNSGITYVAYLFGTVSGVSKVGSYTGTAATLNVDCGFSAGARFVLIKRTDSTGDWYVWDTARGITAGNDPYLLLNSTAAEVTSTDYIDPLSSGFQISSTAPAAINASGGSFIFFAVA